MLMKIQTISIPVTGVIPKGSSQINKIDYNLYKDTLAGTLFLERGWIDFTVVFEDENVKIIDVKCDSLKVNDYSDSILTLRENEEEISATVVITYTKTNSKEERRTNNMVRIFKIDPSWDRQKDANGDFGISESILWIGVKDEDNQHAVVMSIHTGWYLENIIKQKGDLLNYSRKPKSYSVGYYSAINASKIDNSDYDNPNNICEWLGKPYRLEVTSNHTEELMDLLISKGSDAVYKRLEELYKEYRERRESGKLW